MFLKSRHYGEKLYITATGGVVGNTTSDPSFILSDDDILFNNLQLEDGDDFLLEDGAFILLEN